MKTKAAVKMPAIIAKHFPAPFSPRPSQVDLLTQIQAALDDDAIKFIIVEAPPGVGKSHVAIAAMGYMERGYLCTESKLLQDQYMRTFTVHGLHELKGRSSFQCERAKDTCAVGAVWYTGDDACGNGECPCPYKIAKRKALASQITIANYYSLLYNYEGNKRPLIVLDEGHSVEAVLMSYVSVEIKRDALTVIPSQPFPNLPSNLNYIAPEPYIAWLESYYADLEKQIERISDPAEKAAATLLFERIAFVVQHKDEDWIVETFKESAFGFAMKPLTVRAFGKMLFDMGQKVLLMSATILDVTSLCDSIGIPANETRFIRVPCPFPVENRPVYVGNLPMTYKHRETSWPAMVKTVENILGRHANEKGLILAPSNEMLKYLVKHLPPRVSERLILAFGEDRIEKVNKHAASKLPTVLAASGLWAGLDLHGDLSRFQIVPAIPRPHWSGQVAARGKVDPAWYRWRSLVQLIQGVGRSVRSETDHATTYVLDADLRREVNKANTILPPWFVEACQVI